MNDESFNDDFGGDWGDDDEVLDDILNDDNNNGIKLNNNNNNNDTLFSNSVISANNTSQQKHQRHITTNNNNTNENDNNDVGWDDDDDDLFFDDDDNPNNNLKFLNPIEARTTTIMKTNHVTAISTSTLSSSPTIAPSSSYIPNSNKTLITSASKALVQKQVLQVVDPSNNNSMNGWDDDDDDVLDDLIDDDPDAASASNQPVMAAATTTIVAAASTTTATTTTTTILKQTTNINKEETSKVIRSGWDESFNDFDDFDDAHENEYDVASTTKTTTEHLQQYNNEIYDYLIKLELLQISIQSVLDAEYNTIEKAIEMQYYYIERPQLVSYTINKELNRMDYTVRMIDHNDEIYITNDKEIIKQLFIDYSNTSLCPRCSNQSILADILQSFTGHDLLIRPQYHTSAVATTCSFKIDLTQSLVGINASFDISLPTTNGDRWKIAIVDIEIYFGCPMPSTNEQQQPFVQFKVKKIQSLVDQNDINFHKQIENVSKFLFEINQSHQNHDNNNGYGLESQQQQMQTMAATTSISNFRDAFLQTISDSTVTGQNIHDGMKSVWNDIDTVTGISNKTSLLLPSFDLLSQVQEFEEEMALEQQQMQQKQQQQQQQQHSQQKSRWLNALTSSSSSSSMQNAPPIPTTNQQQQQTQQQHPQLQQQRPTSILGGLVSSIVKSVSLPEEDPSLYQEWHKQHSSDDRSTQPTSLFPSKSISPTPSPPRSSNNNILPKLYNKDDDKKTASSGQVSSFSSSISDSFPKLYHRTTTPPEQVVDDHALMNDKTTPIRDNMRIHGAETPPRSNISSSKLRYEVEEEEGLIVDTTATSNINNEGWDQDDIDDYDIDGIDTTATTTTSTTRVITTTTTSTTPQKGAAHTPTYVGNVFSMDEDDELYQQQRQQQVAKGSSTTTETTNTISMMMTGLQQPKKMPYKYDPETDIIPTRTRWINPHPGSRILSSSSVY